MISETHSVLIWTGYPQILDSRPKAARIYMKIECEVKSWVVRPAIKNIEIPDAPSEYANAQKWGWVDYEELSKAAQSLLAKQGIRWPSDGQLKGNSIFEDYGKLEHDSNGKPIFTWCNILGITLKGDPPFASAWWTDFKVPARFSNGVLSLAEQGIVRVTLAKIPLTGTIGHYLEVGHHADGTKLQILNNGRGDGSYRVAPWPYPKISPT